MVNIHFSDLRSASESEAHHWIDGLTWRGDKRGGTKALGLSPNGTTLHLHLMAVKRLWCHVVFQPLISPYFYRTIKNPHMHMDVHIWWIHYRRSHTFVPLSTLMVSCLACKASS